MTSGRWPTSRFREVVEVELTHRQVQGLVAAREAGWLAGPPREGAVGEVADILGITAGAASRRVNRAQNIISLSFLDALDRKASARLRYLGAPRACPFCGAELDCEIGTHLPKCPRREEVAAPR